MRIKTSGDHDQIRTETPYHLFQRRVKRALLLRGGCRRAQRQIQRVTKTTTHSLLSARSRSRIPRILMRREKVDARIVVKNSLRAVAVMNVPIDDRDAFDLGIVLLRITGSDGDVIEQTETHRAFFSRVMTRRTHRHERVVDLAFHDQLNRLTRSAGRVSRLS